MKNTQRKSLLLFITTSIAALCGLLFGYDTGIIADALVLIKTQFKLTVLQQEILVSSVLVGAIVGAGVSGILADKYGRRRLMLSSAILFMFGSLFCAVALTSHWILIGRFIVGLAIGSASYVAPLYISEIAPKEKRGALVILNTIMVTGGIVISYMVGLFLARYSDWRWMFGLGTLPAILLWIGTLFLPKSPRWLAKQGLLTLARSMLMKMRSVKEADEELVEIQGRISQAKNHTLLTRKTLT